MNEISRYIIRLCCACLICGVVNSIGAGWKSKKILNLITGLFIAFTTISPLMEIRIPALSQLSLDYRRNAADLVSYGENISRQAFEDRTTELLEAYILEEADAMNVQVCVEHITLDPQTYTVSGIELSGNATPYERSLLTDLLAEKLGINAEAQIWTE